jgi:septum formation protein
MRLILASASPRRAELLTSGGFEFEIVPADVDESARPGEEAEPYALRVAKAKARHVAEADGAAGGIVLAADTVVVAGSRMMGKPEDESDAASMLKLLAGSVHDVLTAVVLRSAAREVAEVATTRVHFLPLSDDEIRWYIATGEPFGKAGAYAIQGRAARFIDRIEGSWSNVVGLPLASVHRLFAALRDGV